jgi:hypothetical protein
MGGIMFSRQSRRFAFVFALLALAFAAPALANPVAVNACVTISKPGSYRLVKNLNATGDCLIITANWVTIDLNGFVISGNGTGSGILADESAQRRGITVRNGTVQGFESGVNLGGTGTEALIDAVRAIGNSNVGIGVNDSSTVKNSIATENGVGIVTGSRSVVSGNTADFNSDGFNVNLGCTVIGNTAGSNTRDGFEIGNGATVVNNTAFANGRYGFLRSGGNFIGNNATLNTTNVTGPADNAVNNVPSP